MTARRSKALIVALIAGFLVVASVTGVAIVWLLRQLGEAVSERRVHMKARGLEYAKTHSRRECLDEALRELDCDDVFLCEVGGKAFLETCLPSAQRDDLCGSVPRGVGAVGWVVAECARHGATDKECTKMLGPVIQVCFEGGAK